MSNAVLVLPPLFDTAAITAGALSGSLHASRRGLDVVGIFVVAICTGVGGGAVRDVVLQVGVPVFLVTPVWFGYALLGAVAGSFFAGLVRSWVPVLVLLDSLLIGVWVLIGAQKTLAFGLSPIAAVFLGLVTATGGGVLRDLLCREVPSVLQPGQYYALAALVSAVVYVSLRGLEVPAWWAEGATVVVATMLRWLSMHYDLRTPRPVDLSPRLLRSRD